jgi:hypothetical protein
VKKNLKIQNIKVYKNKSIDKITKANTKYRTKKDKEPESRWRKRKVGLDP